MGAATKDWLMGSNVGVIIAPRIKAITTAYRRFLDKNSEVTTPILDRKNRTTGVSNIMPIQNNSVIIRFT